MSDMLIFEKSMSSKNKKERLFREILTEHRDKIYRICAAYLYEKNKVDDLFQDVLVTIWMSLDRFDNKASLTTWLYRVTMNTTITFNKKSQKHRSLFTHKMPPELIDECEPSDEAERQQRIDKLLRCIQKLRQEERLIISFVLEGLAYKEIAAIVGMSTSHVGVKINRIKKKLLRLYEND